MAEQMTARGPAAVPHHGPIRQGCPVACLQAVLSQRAYRPLAQAWGAPFPPSCTVGDVIRLYANRDLGDISGLGPRRISEIEAALVLADFDLSGHQPLPRQSATAACTGGTNGASKNPATAGCPICGAPADFPLAPAQAPSPPRLTQAAERTARVLAWMASNCDRRDVTAAEIAAVADLSVRHLQAVFKHDFGRSPLLLVADMRLHRVHLALTGRAPAPASLADAATLAGYRRVHRFLAAYRERYGRYPALAAQPAPGTAKNQRYPGSPEPEDESESAR